MFISPAVAGEKLIIASCSGKVYGLDRASGKPAWTYDTAEDGPRAEFHGEAVSVGGNLIVPSDSEAAANVYAFDAATGDAYWKMPFEGGVMSTPLVAGQSVIVAGAAGKLARIDAITGKALWTATPDGTRPLLPRISAPAMDAKRVYFTSNDPRLFALDASTGKTLWKQDLPARINTSLAVHGGLLYGGGGNHLYAFDPATGVLRHRLLLGGLPYGTLVFAPPLVIVLVNGSPSKLVAVDLASHAVKWERTTPREWTTMKPLVHDGAVIAGTEEKELCAFALSDGEPRWCMSVPQVPRGLGTAEGMLYLGTLNGRVLAYRLPK